MIVQTASQALLPRNPQAMLMSQHEQVAVDRSRGNDELLSHYLAQVASITNLYGGDNLWVRAIPLKGNDLSVWQNLTIPGSVYLFDSTERNVPGFTRQYAHFSKVAWPNFLAGANEWLTGGGAM